jgi:lipopolysaccharide export system protein LptA
MPMLPSICFTSRPVFLQFLVGFAALGAIAYPATAQTLDQPGFNEPGITLQSDTQQLDPDTGTLTATGNVRLSYPAQQLEGFAEQVQYLEDQGLLILSGEARLTQQGEVLEGEQITCRTDVWQCTTDSSTLSAADSALSISLSLLDDAWVRVTVDGVIEHEGVMQSGDRHFWQATEQITIRTGDAGAVMVSRNGERPQPMGDRGEVEEITFSTSETP